MPEFLHAPLHVREQEVVYPAREQSADALAGLLGRRRVAPLGEHSDLGLEGGELLFRDARPPSPFLILVEGIP